MRAQWICVLLFAGGTLLCAATSGKTSPRSDEPQYDPATEISMLATVTEVRDVPHGSPLSGIHLLVRPEAHDSQVVEAYLGPEAFIKQFDLHLAKGDEVRLTGSRVKTSGGSRVILVREIRKNEATLSCRRPTGKPNWE